MSTTTNTFEELTIPPNYHTKGLKEPVWVYSTSHFREVPDFAMLRYVEGAEHPSKGIPTPDGVYAVNIIKTLLKESVRYIPYFIFVKKDKLLTSFNSITNRVLKPVVKDHVAVPHNLLCPTAFAVYSIISNFLVNIGVNEHIAENTAYNIAHIFEHDDAWRYRLQDMATETDVDQLFQNPTKELKRLIAVFEVRQAITHNNGYRNIVTERVERFVNILKLVLLIPKYRNAFKQSIRFVKDMAYDDADWFWVCCRSDYNYGGKTVDERGVGITRPKQYLIS